LSTRFKFYASNTGVGALYGPLVLYRLPVSVHRTVVNAFKVTMN